MTLYHVLYTSKRFTAESHFSISLKTAIPFLITGRCTSINSSVGSSQTSRAHPSADEKMFVFSYKIFNKNSRTLPPLHSATMCDLAARFSGMFVIFSVSFDPHRLLPD